MKQKVIRIRKVQSIIWTNEESRLREFNSHMEYCRHVVSKLARVTPKNNRILWRTVSTTYRKDMVYEKPKQWYYNFQCIILLFYHIEINHNFFNAIKIVISEKKQEETRRKVNYSS